MSAAETTEVQMVNLTINGREVQARPGQTILGRQLRTPVSRSRPCATTRVWSPTVPAGCAWSKWRGARAYGLLRDGSA